MFSTGGWDQSNVPKEGEPVREDSGQIDWAWSQGGCAGQKWQNSPVLHLLCQGQATLHVSLFIDGHCKIGSIFRSLCFTYLIFDYVSRDGIVG